MVLDEPIPGLDHLNKIDAEEFAWHNSNQHAESLGVIPLDIFTFAPFEQPEWHETSEGLKTVQALRSLYIDWIGKGTNPYHYTQNVLTEKAAVLEKVEEVLTAAASHGCKFYLAARDL